MIYEVVKKAWHNGREVARIEYCRQNRKWAHWGVDAMGVCGLTESKAEKGFQKAIDAYCKWRNVPRNEIEIKNGWKY